MIVRHLLDAGAQERLGLHDLERGGYAQALHDHADGAVLLLEHLVRWTRRCRCGGGRSPAAASTAAIQLAERADGGPAPTASSISRTEDARPAASGSIA